MRTKLTFLIFLIFQMVHSQSSDSLYVEFTPYSSFRGLFGVFNEEIEIQENASRIGFEISVKKGDVRFFTGVELGVNLFKSSQLFNADANTNSGFLNIETVLDSQVFSNRLGFVGVDFGSYGTVSIGKMWSVYYDVTGYTDKFNVFGGKGSATYVANSDGGEIGTGRASRALIYRNSLGAFNIGLQLQFRNTVNDHLVDGMGLSVQYEVCEGLKLGGAYNRSNLEDSVIENTLGLDDDPEYLSFGVSYIADSWDLGFVYARQKNGDGTKTELEQDIVSAVYDANGLEAFAKFKRPKYSLVLGYNQYNPDLNDLMLETKFDTQDFIVGAEYKPSHVAYIYSEFRLTNGNGRIGIVESNVLTVGIRFDLSHTFSKTIK